MTDMLDDMQQRITRRLAELKPVLEEYRQLEAASTALNGIPTAPNGGSTTSPRPTPGRRGPGRPRGSKTTATPTSTPVVHQLASTTKPTAKRKRGRRKGSGKRAR